MKNLLLWVLLLFPVSLYGNTFDHDHKKLNDLLEIHVKMSLDHTFLKVDYQQFKKNRLLLKAYLDDLSNVSLNEYNS